MGWRICIKEGNSVSKNYSFVCSVTWVQPNIQNKNVNIVKLNSFLTKISESYYDKLIFYARLQCLDIGILTILSVIHYWNPPVRACIALEYCLFENGSRKTCDAHNNVQYSTGCLLLPCKRLQSGYNIHFMNEFVRSTHLDIVTKWFTRSVDWSQWINIKISMSTQQRKNWSNRLANYAWEDVVYWFSIKVRCKWSRSQWTNIGIPLRASSRPNQCILTKLVTHDCPWEHYAYCKCLKNKTQKYFA